MRNFNPASVQDRQELRQLLEAGKRDHWEVCTDGRTIGEDAGDDMAKWIGETGPCAAELIVAAVNALPALLDALDDAEAALDRVRKYAREQLRMADALHSIDRPYAALPYDNTATAIERIIGDRT